MNRGKVNEIREALSCLPSLGRAELRAEWQRLYGTDAPVRLGHELLIGAIAWRLQENMLGGLRPELRRRLRHVAEQARHGGQVVPAAPRLKPGTRLIREWQGRTHEVVVGENGFLWQQAHYRSLSKIARAITGTPWSGPVFFGLKPRTVARRGAGVDADASII
jgi:hypothetical protein